MLVVYAPTDGTGELLSTWSLCEGRVCLMSHGQAEWSQKKSSVCSWTCLLLSFRFLQSLRHSDAHVVHTDKIETVVSMLAISERTGVE